ncbi:MAG: FtsX-like permease family protein, partial [Terriglobales bacterium]
GCGQARLLRRFLARSVRLALIGGGGGLLIAFWALPVLARLLPSAAAGAAAIPLDWRALVFAAGVSLAAGLVTGLIPAWRGSRANLARDVRDGVAAPEPAGRLPLPSLLLIGEIALALVVVIAGALVAQSLRNLTRQDPGFRATGVTTVRVHPAAAYCAAAARCAEFYRQLRARAAALPGVRSAAVVNSVPLGGIPEIAAVVFQDHPLLPGKPVALIWADIVTPGYRATAGIPLLQGRDFSASDGPQSQPVALISASLAGSLWPGQTALGKTVTTLTTGMRAWTIVGVVEGVREFQLQGDPGFYRGEVYFPLAQAMATPPLAGSMATMTLVLRSPAPPTAATLRRMIVDLNPEAAADQPRTLRAIVYASVAGPRTTAWLFGWFALLALAMAMFGVYAVMGEAVGQRHREMGVRLALGARPAAIFRLVLFRGLVCAAAGIGLGAAAAWLLCRLLRNLLFEVSPADPVLFAGAALLVLAAAMLACCGPARRASRVDPAAALRGE